MDRDADHDPKPSFPSLPDAEQLATAAAVLARSERLVVLTGAGISTDSGVPDFRGPAGLWTKNPAAEKASDIRHYTTDPEVRAAAWQGRVHNPVWSAKPNAAHRLIAEHEANGRLHAIITQNIDGLHQAGGSSDDKVIEVHGTVHYTRCLECGDRLPMQQTLDRVRNGETDPPCNVCGGMLKSDTISFGQQLIPEVLECAFTAARECDVLLAIGSTLSVGPVNHCVPIAADTGATVIILNGQPTDMDQFATYRFVSDIATTLPLILAGG